jgi:hypothetical protein
VRLRVQGPSAVALNIEFQLVHLRGDVVKALRAQKKPSFLTRGSGERQVFIQLGRGLPRGKVEVFRAALRVEAGAMASASMMVDLPVPFSPTMKVTGFVNSSFPALSSHLTTAGPTDTSRRQTV